MFMLLIATCESGEMQQETQMFVIVLLTSNNRIKRQLCVFRDLNTFYKNTSACAPVTLDKSICHAAYCIISIPQNKEEKRQPFPYREALPARRLSFVLWFHSSVLQSRYPTPECYHCKQKGKDTCFKSCTEKSQLACYTGFCQSREQKHVTPPPSARYLSRCIELSK